MLLELLLLSNSGHQKLLIPVGYPALWAQGIKDKAYEQEERSGKTRAIVLL